LEIGADSLNLPAHIQEGRNNPEDLREKAAGLFLRSLLDTQDTTPRAFGIPLNPQINLDYVADSSKA
jgi:hypothetical protein